MNETLLDQWYNQRLGGNGFKKKTRSKKSRDTVPLTSTVEKIVKMWTKKLQILS